jgi:hypothetical protein
MCLHKSITCKFPLLDRDWNVADPRSHTTDVKMSLRGNTIYLDTWLDMLEEKESWSPRANYPRTRRLYGLQLRIGRRWYAKIVERLSQGKSSTVCFI